MEFLTNNPLITGLILSNLLFLYLFSKKSREKSQSPPLANLPAEEVSMLRSQIRQFRANQHSQMEIQVNFPEVIKSLTAAITRPQVTSACSRGIESLLYTKSIAIFLIDQKNILKLVDGVGFKRTLLTGPGFSLEESGLDSVVGVHRVVELSDCPEARDFLERHGVPNELACPLRYGQRKIGLVTIARFAGDSTFVKRIFVMICDLVGVALHAAETVRKIQSRAEIDLVTGIPNRKAFERRLDFEVDHCDSYESEMSLILMGINQFTLLREQLGREAVEGILKGVSKAAFSVIRKTDMVARYGNNTLAFILSGAGSEAALINSRRIKNSIEGYQRANRSRISSGSLSVSFGIASFPGDSKSSKALFGLADQRLQKNLL